MVSRQFPMGIDGTSCYFLSHAASVKFMIGSIQLFYQEKSSFDFTPINLNSMPYGIARLVFDK